MQSSIAANEVLEQVARLHWPIGTALPILSNNGFIIVSDRPTVSVVVRCGSICAVRGESKQKAESLLPPRRVLGRRRGVRNRRPRFPLGTLGEAARENYWARSLIGVCFWRRAYSALRGGGG